MMKDCYEIEKRLAITHVLEKDDLIVLKKYRYFFIEDGEYAWKIEWDQGFIKLSYGQRGEPLIYDIYPSLYFQRLNDDIIKAKQHFLEFISIPYEKRLWG